jgi:type I site-specific restriction endonuclease
VSPSPGAPEQKARAQIDAALTAAGWIVQDRDAMNLSAGRGVAVREFKLTPGHGFADYLLFVDGKAVGVLEAKPEGHTLSGVEVQAEKYSTGLRTGQSIGSLTPRPRDSSPARSRRRAPAASPSRPSRSGPCSERR